MIRFVRAAAWVTAVVSLAVVYAIGGWRCVVAATVWGVALELRDELKPTKEDVTG